MMHRRMASLFSLNSRPQALFRLASAANRSVCRRNFHLTTVVQQTRDDDLFSSVIPSETSVPDPSKSTTASKAKFQDAAARRAPQFYELVEYVINRTGRKRAVKAGQVRQTAWLRLFQLASSSEQLEMVAELFPRWRDSGKEFRPIHAEAFVRRCEELNCPTLALKVFGDHSKYGLALSSLFAARHMLHSVYDKRPLSDSMTVAALFGVYKLPPVSSDLAACSMLYVACLKDNSANARIVAKALYEELHKQVQDKPPVKAPQESVIRARYAEKPNIWLLDALKTIEKVHKKTGKEWRWIRYWTTEREWRPRDTFTPIQPATAAEHA
ncbi:uncharacterized protein F5891DRAFT_763932 [Suillus fuscotomentosus]|uniref:Uncharacterized protein n=1 Tax=Suillus fuscotomentosus TaxID=1912939 RepID=A0AAD4HER0_9AGAM|nr:uncharacterized protein F5891DRAFT_763932 [Suillus fuscotomentosus]KAG1893817.1 hypothetical protein F5891DRAFT_763932 [Suillus fuscotomentosus]